MISYPESLPHDAVQVVFQVATEGFADEGQHGDQACFYNALWNLQGYGLNVWKPHRHALRTGEIPKPMRFGRWSAPKSDSAQMAALVKLLEPIQSSAGPKKSEDQEGSDGSNGPTQTVGAEIDWQKIPWDQVVMLITLILQSLLRKQKQIT